MPSFTCDEPYASKQKQEILLISINLITHEVRYLTWACMKLQKNLSLKKKDMWQSSLAVASNLISLCKACRKVTVLKMVA